MLIINNKALFDKNCKTFSKIKGIAFDADLILVITRGRKVLSLIFTVSIAKGLTNHFTLPIII